MKPISTNSICDLLKSWEEAILKVEKQAPEQGSTLIALRSQEAQDLDRLRNGPTSHVRFSPELEAAGVVRKDPNSYVGEGYAPGPNYETTYVIAVRRLAKGRVNRLYRNIYP